MIRKSELVEAINNLEHDLCALSIKVHEIERFMLKNNTEKKEKRRPGRPRKI